MGQILNVRSRGIDDVERVWTRFVPSARLDRVDPRTVAFAWESVELDRFSVVSWQLTASVHASIEMTDQLMACRMVGDDLRLTSGPGAIAPRLPWLASERRIDAEWTGSARVRAFVFDRTDAERVARVASGDDRLVLRRVDPAPRSRDAATQWERSFAHVSSSLGATHEEPILAEELRRHALLTTLSAFSTPYVEAVARAHQRAAAPRTVRRAIAHIEAHAQQPLTLEDIAAASGISSRGLQHAFRRELDTTPTEYLRRVRLSAAHDELRAGTAVSVAEVARRWGFSSASRFARYHREHYGQNPAQVIRMS
ncbi:AraC-like DNA-binding protein [Microbacterium sp. SORGH_AS 1204]|uniref:helix-turn-helix transcriptional regulator n=1 Tax=Microbacterium sp. SORGH_AS_1204 TaxID=3041785 RepID=UPI00278D329D|nr:helix-turn-helix transcriptional regulator [Microbacterium sp. SORGH_AS_1204]MDQ1136051.1 AraC-like DNA-binding protein [Microbacterium sp. SORGH_AS_1204]